MSLHRIEYECQSRKGSPRLQERGEGEASHCRDYVLLMVVKRSGPILVKENGHLPKKKVNGCYDPGNRKEGVSLSQWSSDGRA
jgi:hypothetical protein